MLVLSRREGERVIIRDRQSGREITVMVVEARANGGSRGLSRLGFEADPDFEILREEIDGRLHGACSAALAAASAH